MAESFRPCSGLRCRMVFAFLVAIGFGILAKQLLNEYQRNNERKAELEERNAARQAELELEARRA